MAYYPDQRDPNVVEDLAVRREYYALRAPVDTSPALDVTAIRDLSEAIVASSHLHYTNHQLYIARVFSPHTRLRTLLLKWGTGLGKTRCALGVAMEFVKKFREETDAGATDTGSIFVMGFNDRIFRAELLKFVEFGFISADEKRLDAKLRKSALNGNTHDLESLKELRIRIKKRFGSRKGNGFFRFVGYREFVNRLFIGDGVDGMTEDDVRKGIADGTIKLNTALTGQFRNSLMICDEIHNVYNSTEPNLWGVAIGSIMENQPTCRALFLSATPLNNSPTEIIDLLNLLRTSRLSKRDFFTPGGKLLPGALAQIAKLSRGYVSYLRDVNPEDYPSFEMIGERISSIPYLKFQRCKMSSWQIAGYRTAIASGTLAHDAQYIVDFCLPGPTAPLYRTEDVRRELTNASDRWKQKNQIDYEDHRVIGRFMEMPGLAKFSSKYAEMMRTLVANAAIGKIFIYHNYIHMSGVFFIEQVLLANGVLDEFGMPTNNTLCVCGKRRHQHAKHGKFGAHESTPMFGGFTGYSRDVSDDTIDDTLNDDTLTFKQWLHIDTPESKTSDLIPVHHQYTVKKISPNHLLIENNGMPVLSLTTKIYISHAGTLHLPADKRTILRDILRDIVARVSCKVTVECTLQDELLREILLDIGFAGIDAINTIAYSIDGTGTLSCQDLMVGASGGMLGGVSGANGDVNGGASNTNIHTFQPMRFLSVHGELQPGVIEQTLEKFNSSENTQGTLYKIIVGSRVMKESHSLLGVRQIYMMSRPDNISSFVQIRGRAIRNKSHSTLPPSERNVSMYVFVASTPHGLSHEETKYKEKVESYQVIQEIERTLHENAIDSMLNHGVVTRDITPGTLDSLPFQVNSPLAQKYSSITRLHDSTFGVYYRNAEVNVLIQMIKRFFLEVSPVFTYEDLLVLTKQPNVTNADGNVISFSPGWDTSLISDSSFNVALHKLLYADTTDYTEPRFVRNNVVENYIDHLFDSSERIIFTDRAEFIITKIGKYYMLMPTNQHGEPIITVDSVYRTHTREVRKLVNINHLAGRMDDFDYDNKRRMFYHKWMNVSIEHMEGAICEHGIQFHLTFIEELIVYIFQAWVSAKFTKHLMHEFYFKMLFYYDLLNLVIFAHTSKPKFAAAYSKFVVPYRAKNIKLMSLQLHEKRVEAARAAYRESKKPTRGNADAAVDTADASVGAHGAGVSASDVGIGTAGAGIETRVGGIPPLNPERKSITVDMDDEGDDTIKSSGIINVLRSSIWKSSATWAPFEIREGYAKILQASLDTFNGKVKKANVPAKVPAEYLPVGHFLGKFPRLYHPNTGWSDTPEYVDPDEIYVENDIIIGFDERLPNATHIHFKLRSPIHNIKKYADTRRIETGSTCKTKGKIWLLHICKKLGVTPPDKFNIEELCVLVRTKLIRNEMKERIRGSKKKWYYPHYEPRPELRHQ